MSETTKVIYKILRAAEWQAAKGEAAFEGSPDDLRDGFIHFSNAGQLRETVTKYFSDEREIVLLAVDADALGDALKWEVSRGGMKFPHLYAPMPMAAATQVTRLKRQESGGFVFPDEIP